MLDDPLEVGFFAAVRDVLDDPLEVDFFAVGRDRLDALEVAFFAGLLDAEPDDDRLDDPRLPSDLPLPDEPRDEERAEP